MTPTTPLPALSESQLLVSDLLSSVTVRLPVLDLGVRVGVEGAAERLAESLRWCQGILNGLEGLIRDRALASLSEGIAEALDALEPTEDLRRAARVIRGLPGWADQTQAARERVRLLWEEDLDAAQSPVRGLLASESYLRTLTELQEFAQQPALKRKQDGEPPKGFLPAMLKDEAELLKELRHHAEELTEKAAERSEKARAALQGADAGEQDEQKALKRREKRDRAVERAVEAWGVALRGAEEAEGLLRAVRSECSPGKMTTRRLEKLERQIRKVRGHHGGIEDASLAAEWLERAGRVFQRREIDRWAVGSLHGELRAGFGPGGAALRG